MVGLSVIPPYGKNCLGGLSVIPPLGKNCPQVELGLCVFTKTCSFVGLGTRLESKLFLLSHDLRVLFHPFLLFSSKHSKGENSWRGVIYYILIQSYLPPCSLPFQRASGLEGTICVKVINPLYTQFSHLF